MGLDGSAILLSVQVSPGPPGVYAEIGGQTGLKDDRKSKDIDFSDKSTVDEIVQPGSRSGSITLDNFYIPGDAGFAALKAAYKSGQMIIAEWIEEGTVIEWANCTITGLSRDAKRSAPVTVSVTLSVSGGWQTGAAP